MIDNSELAQNESESRDNQHLLVQDKPRLHQIFAHDDPGRPFCQDHVKSAWRLCAPAIYHEHPGVRLIHICDLGKEEI